LKGEQECRKMLESVHIHFTLEKEGASASRGGGGKSPLRRVLGLTLSVNTERGKGTRSRKGEREELERQFPKEKN